MDNTKNTFDIEKSNLELIQQDETNKIENIKKNIEEKITYINTYVEKYFLELDDFFGISIGKRALNDNYEIYISARNFNYKTQAESLYTKLLTDFLQNHDFEYVAFEKFSLDFQELLNVTILALDNSIASNAFSQNDIDLLKEKFQGYLQNYKQNYSDYVKLKLSLDYEYNTQDIKIKEQKNKIETLSGQLIQIQNTFDTLINNYSVKKQQIEQQLKQAQNQYNIAKLNYKKSVNDISNQNEILQKNYALSQSKYADIVSTPSSIQLAPFKKAVENAKNDLAIAEQKLKDSVLVSGVDGFIYDIGFQYGETLTQNNNFVKINTKNNFYIESFVEELSISKVFLNQEVDITLDSMPEYTSTGRVSFISDSSYIDQNGVVEYKVIIDFQDNSGKVKDGMSVSLDYILQSFSHTLLVPAKSIQKEGEKNFVILENGVKKYIKIGINNGNYTQVLDGLNVGEGVIIP